MAIQYAYRTRDGKIYEGTYDQVGQWLRSDYDKGQSGQVLFKGTDGSYYSVPENTPQYKNIVSGLQRGAQDIGQTIAHELPSNVRTALNHKATKDAAARGPIKSNGTEHTNAPATDRKSFGHASSKEMENYAKEYRYDPKNPDNAVFMNEYNLAISNMKQMKQNCANRLRGLWIDMHTPGKTSSEMIDLSAAYNQIYAQYNDITDAQKKLKDPRHYIKTQVDAVNAGTRTQAKKKNADGTDSNEYDWSDDSNWSLSNINSYIANGGAPAKKNIWANIGGWIANTAKEMPKPDINGDLSHTAPTEAGNRIVNALTGGVGKDPSNKTAWDRANANLQQQQAANEQKNAQYTTQQGTSNYRVEADKDAASQGAQQSKQNVNGILNAGAGNAALVRQTATANNDDRRNFAAQQFDKGADYNRVANEGQQAANLARSRADIDDYQYNQMENYNDTASSLSMGGYNTEWKGNVSPQPAPPPPEPEVKPNPEPETKPNPEPETKPNPEPEVQETKPQPQPAPNPDADIEKEVDNIIAQNPSSPDLVFADVKNRLKLPDANTATPEQKNTAYRKLVLWLNKSPEYGNVKMTNTLNYLNSVRPQGAQDAYLGKKINRTQ